MKEDIPNAPCPACGSEERHERTGQLLCECPCPVAVQLESCRRSLALANVRLSNQDYMLVNRLARMEHAEAVALSLRGELGALRDAVERLRREAERSAQLMPGGVMMHPSAVLRMLGPKQVPGGSPG